jgi:hypothetical protein
VHGGEARAVDRSGQPEQQQRTVESGEEGDTAEQQEAEPRGDLRARRLPGAARGAAGAADEVRLKRRR